ncbi:hypothetical protein chiPu_0014465 [Chiloscyllium punctatum]|uniref:Uncharacterized protein n=1 Tax=Chiloscyllium punctatum TaxID=137246 RepID=A0A401T025_CHIPU|nr:hypothetical protein [Chiloscyllium punctatum]
MAGRTCWVCAAAESDADGIASRAVGAGVQDRDRDRELKVLSQGEGCSGPGATGGAAQGIGSPGGSGGTVGFEPALHARWRCGVRARSERSLGTSGTILAELTKNRLKLKRYIVLPRDYYHCSCDLADLIISSTAESTQDCFLER